MASRLSSGSSAWRLGEQGMGGPELNAFISEGTSMSCGWSPQVAGPVCPNPQFLVSGGSQATSCLVGGTSGGQTWDPLL